MVEVIPLGEIYKRPYIVKKPCVRSERIHYVINPNKYYGNKIIYSLSEFFQTMDAIIHDMGLDLYDWRVERIDLAIHTTSDYDLLYKLNCYLKELYTIRIACKNAYRIIGDDMKKRSTIVKNDKFELEIYNKRIESNRIDIPQTRIEFRRKSLYKKIQNAFEYYTRIIVQSIQADILSFPEYIADLERIKQKVLLEGYELESSQSREGRTKNLREFAIKYADFIYTRNNLKSLFESINPFGCFCDWLHYFIKSGHIISFINKTTLKMYCGKLNSAIHYYLKN